jgi:hypothetical protein
MNGNDGELISRCLHYCMRLSQRKECTADFRSPPLRGFGFIEGIYKHNNLCQRVDSRAFDWGSGRCGKQGLFQQGFER